MEQTTGMPLGELLKKLYFNNITLRWDSDADPIAKIYNLIENDWVLSEELLIQKCLVLKHIIMRFIFY